MKGGVSPEVIFNLKMTCVVSEGWPGGFGMNVDAILNSFCTNFGLLLELKNGVGHDTQIHATLEKCIKFMNNFLEFLAFSSWK